MSEDRATDFQRVHLERLKLAADVLLAEAGDIPDTLEVELRLFKDRIETAILRPAAPSDRQKLGTRVRGGRYGSWNPITTSANALASARLPDTFHGYPTHSALPAHRTHE